MASAATLRVEFFKDEWNTVLRRAASGNFRYESTRVSRLVDSRIIGAGTDSGSFQLSPPEFGSYRVMISDPESDASATPPSRKYPERAASGKTTRSVCGDCSATMARTRSRFPRASAFVGLN